MSSEGEGMNCDSAGNQSGDEGSLFSQNFNASNSHYRDSESGSRNSRYARSVRSIDSGDVTQNIRKLDRIGTAVACKNKKVPIQDEDGNVI